MTVPIRFRWTPAALMVGLAVTFGACRGAEPQAPPAGAAAAPAPPSDVVVLDAEAQQRAGLAIDTIRTVVRTEAAEAPGLVALNEMRTARIGALVEGIVMDVLVQPGARVTATQRLASMHSHAVHDSWAGYRKAVADERRLTTELRYASDAQARAERLYADRAVSLQDLQRAQANRAAAEENLDMGRTELRRAQEELEHLGITSGDDPTGESGEQIPVRTPFAGVVLERLVTPGTAVSQGTPMFVVSDLATLWVLAELDEAHLAGAHVGFPVQVRVPAYPGVSFAGTVTHVGEMVNPKTRRVTVRCEVPNPDGRLKPEMYATVEIGQGEPKSVLVVPSAAVQAVNGHPSVFIAQTDTQFRAQPVNLGGERDDLLEVRDGLRAGDKVVVSGAFVLKSELLKPSADGGE